MISFCFACSTGKLINIDSLAGKFYGKSDGYAKNITTQYYLELGADNIFHLKIKGHDYGPECSGSWIRKEDTLYLKCSDTENLADKLSGGYMNQREFKIKIKNKDMLKMDKVSLKRR